MASHDDLAKMTASGDSIPKTGETTKRPTKKLESDKETPEQEHGTAVASMDCQANDDSEYQLSDRGQAIIIAAHNMPDINMPDIFRTAPEDEEIFNDDSCRFSDDELPPLPAFGEREREEEKEREQKKQAKKEDGANTATHPSDRGQAIIIAAHNMPDINMPYIFRTASDDEKIFNDDSCRFSDDELPPLPPPKEKKKRKKQAKKEDGADTATHPSDLSKMQNQFIKQCNI